MMTFQKTGSKFKKFKLKPASAFGKQLLLIPWTLQRKTLDHETIVELSPNELQIATFRDEFATMQGTIPCMIEFIDSRDFGAVGDGIADETGVFQKPCKRTESGSSFRTASTASKRRCV
jgi:hypothetical protein